MEDEINFNYFLNNNSKLFYKINSTFWDSDQNIYRNFTIKVNQIKKIITKIDNSFNMINKQWDKDTLTNKFVEEKKQIEKGFSILLNKKHIEIYLNYLKVNFILSGPIILDKLITNFNNKVFPYFCFAIQTENSNYKFNFVIFDYIKNIINFFRKETLSRGLSINLIKNLSFQNNKVNIKTFNDEEIIFSPSVSMQYDLIVHLLIFMITNKNSQSNHPREEHNPNITYSTKIDTLKYKLNDDLVFFKDDWYVPYGIILKTNIKKRHKHIKYRLDNRHMVLGKSSVILFK